MATFWQLLAVGTAGAFGTVARFGVNHAMTRLFGPHPWGTVVVNLVGCLLFGFLAAIFVTEKLPSHYKIVILTGFLGGFTTFSAYAFEIADFLEKSRYAAAMFHFALQNVVGVLAIFAGLMLGRSFAA